MLIVQTDLEEAKGQEIQKLQNSLQTMQAKVDETTELLTKERESAQKAIEEASNIVKETAPIHVEDTEKIDKLSAEVEDLKVMLAAHKFCISFFNPLICMCSGEGYRLQCISCNAARFIRD